MSTPNNLITAAEAYTHLPYVYGAKGPDAYDCSGLITQAMADVGVEFPHGSSFQIDAVAKPLLPGDAVHTRGALLYRPGHVAISRGDGTTIEARNPTDGIGTFSANGRGWTRAGLLPVIGESMSQLINRALTRAGNSVGKGSAYSGMCEKFVRSCYGFTAKHASARIAWEKSGGKHHGDMNAPAGVPVFWDILSGRNAPYDHIAISIGGGWCISTSAGPGGTVAKVRISDLTRRWGMKYRGWAEIYHGVRVYNAPKPAPTTPARVKPKIARLRLDGDFGPITIKALQKFLWWYGSHYLGRIDGKFGHLTVKGLQRYLRAGGRYRGWIDGDFGHMTVRALQNHLTHHGHYRGRIDGQFGPMTVRALQDYLNRTMA